MRLYAVRRRNRLDGRFMWALLLSVLVHAWLVKLNLGGDGLLGLGALWQDRRAAAPELRVTLARPPAPVLEVPAPVSATAPTVPLPAARPSPRADRPAAPQIAPEPPAPPEVTVMKAVPAVTALAEELPEPESLSAAAPDLLPAIDSVPQLIAMEPGGVPAWVAPVPEAKEAVEASSAKLEAERVEAARLEAERIEAARLETARIEAAKRDAAKLEAERVEAARLEAERIEAERLETARIESARREAAKLEAAKIEAAKLEAAKLEAAKLEAAKLEAAKLEAAKLEAAKLEAAKLEAAKAEARKAVATKGTSPPPGEPREDPREARLRALAKVLEEEAKQREAAEREASQLPLSLSTARRYRLFGRGDPNPAIERYAMAWSRKIEMNMRLDYLRDALRQPYRSPLVTVAIRGNGTVEAVRFVISSGVPALDEAIRNVVMGQAPYAVFPPELALEYDVIEIRRTWHFDSAIRLN